MDPDGPEQRSGRKSLVPCGVACGCLGLLLSLVIWTGMAMRKQFGPVRVPLEEVSRMTGVVFPPTAVLLESQFQQTPGESGTVARVEIPRDEVDRFLAGLPAARRTSHTECMENDDTHYWTRPPWWDPLAVRHFVAVDLDREKPPYQHRPQLVTLVISLDDPQRAVVYCRRLSDWGYAHEQALPAPPSP